MKFFKYTFIVLIFSSISNAQNWHQLDDFPGMERDDGTSFVIGNMAYCGTGNLPWGVGTIDFYALNMDNDTWSAIASLPIGKERQYACGFSNATHGFIFGGYNAGNFFNDLWQYNPISNSWTEKTPLPDVGRSASVHFVIGDTAYIVCGKTATDYAINEVWAYDMNNDSWQQKNDFPFGNRWRSSGISSNTKGYLIFGKDETLSYEESLYEYDPITDTWTQINNFPGIGRTHAKMEYFGENLILLTGYDSLGNSYNDMWRYDLVENQWHQLNSIPADERRGGMCFKSGTAIYYTAGINASHIRIKETWKNINPTGVSENLEFKLLIYPNPVQNYFRIELPNYFFEGKVVLSDLSGKIYLEQNLEAITEIDCSAFPSGIFIAQLILNDFVFSQQIVVLH